MIGSIIGDIIGSPYEFNKTKDANFEIFKYPSTFTDDTVMSVATAYCILCKEPYDKIYRLFGRQYPGVGYGGMFKAWLADNTQEAYNSYGNGSAMRVSPVGYAYDTIEEILEQAKNTAIVTHNHEEGIKGAQATAVAVFMARKNCSKDEIRSKIIELFTYDMSRTCDTIRPGYSFKVSCQESVPEAIIAFLDSTSFEDAIRKAVSLGGDADTLACITGGIAQAFYKAIPRSMARTALVMLPNIFLKIIKAFNIAYKVETQYD
jgi:ADP-ribosyl-[dinitrogen reductase] hydrolase